MKTLNPEPCTVHGVRHRPGTAAAISCEALAGKAAAAEPAQPTRVGRHAAPAALDAPPVRPATVSPLRHFTAAPVEVTVEDLRQVLTGRMGTLRRRRVAPGHHVVTVLGLNLGDLVADAQGVRELVAHCGSLDAAALDLTLALQHEQRHDVAA